MVNSILMKLYLANIDTDNQIIDFDYNYKAYSIDANLIPPYRVESYQASHDNDRAYLTGVEHLEYWEMEESDLIDRILNLESKWKEEQP